MDFGVYCLIQVIAHKINDSNFSEQQQANEISSDTSCSLQRCLVNQSQSSKTNESTMDIKHASACVVHNFSFIFFFLLNRRILKVSREYICQDFDT
jgi:hypothetical protein